MLNQDPYVAAAVMFGRGYFQAGIIVDPKPDFKFDPSDKVELAEFRNKIWYFYLPSSTTLILRDNEQAYCSEDEQICASTFSTLQGGLYFPAFAFSNLTGCLRFR